MRELYGHGETCVKKLSAWKVIFCESEISVVSSRGKPSSRVVGGAKPNRGLHPGGQSGRMGTVWIEQFSYGCKYLNLVSMGASVSFGLGWNADRNTCVEP